VIHSLFIPAFRIKEDCVPGLKTHLWFTADEAGSYDIFCTEYCGVGHSHMRSLVVAMPEREFAAWYGEAAAQKPAARGLGLLSEKGCLSCHSVDGAPGVGPTLKGVFNRRITVLEQGKEKEVIADEAYLATSILQPGVVVVKGYQPLMPVVQLSDAELQAIIDYLKQLK
jgi:cytochrome c oxidase subunit 2